MDTWSIVSRTIALEFSDLGNVEQLTQLIVRVLLAAILGGAIGLEREMHQKPAGLRTHMLLAMGSALFILVPMQAGFTREELSRVMQGLLAGVGLLCAGSILKSTSGDDQISGLTTAAGLWLTTAIGAACALGRESTAVLTTVLVLLILLLEKPVRRVLSRRGEPAD